MIKTENEKVIIESSVFGAIEEYVSITHTFKNFLNENLIICEGDASPEELTEYCFELGMKKEVTDEDKLELRKKLGFGTGVCLDKKDILKILNGLVDALSDESEEDDE